MNKDERPEAVQGVSEEPRGCVPMEGERVRVWGYEKEGVVVQPQSSLHRSVVLIGGTWRVEVDNSFLTPLKGGCHVVD